MKKFNITLGPLALSLATQLAPFDLPQQAVEQLDYDTDSINRLFIRGILTDREFERAQSRLIKKIGELIKKSHSKAKLSKPKVLTEQ